MCDDADDDVDVEFHVHARARAMCEVSKVSSVPLAANDAHRHNASHDDAKRLAYVVNQNWSARCSVKSVM